MNAPRILIIDDDRELAAMLGEFLRLEGFVVQLLHDAPSPASWALLQASADLVILDVMLPSRSGFELLREWRSVDGAPRVPILMLTARGDAVDRILGLELGADDYLPKPFDPRELAARARAILRRSQGNAEPRPGNGALVRGQLQIDPARRRARIGEQTLELTAAELRVLTQLAEAAGSVVERADLTLQALGRPLTAYDRSVDTHVSNLRRKLAVAGAADIELRAVRGAGYEMIVREAP